MYKETVPGLDTIPLIDTFKFEQKKIFESRAEVRTPHCVADTKFCVTVSNYRDSKTPILEQGNFNLKNASVLSSVRDFF